MRPSGRTRKRTHRWLGVMALAAILATPACGRAESAGSAQPTVESQQAWQAAIARIPQPGKGCFTADYPRLMWRQVLCTTAPTYPMPPRRGPRPMTVGNGVDVSAKVPSGFISTAIGSFDNVVGVTSESGPIGNSGPSFANTYTLQLNTNFFPSTVCAGSPNPGCLGWQQFVYENNPFVSRAFIQYWLIQYNTTCPAGVGWNQVSFVGDPDIYCWKNNSLGAVPVPTQPITNLQQLSLAGAVGSGGDSVTLFAGLTAYTRVGDNAVNAAVGWNIAEFNVFGDGGNSSGGGMATFNPGAALTVRTRTIYGGTAAPLCVAQGFTAETNNLGFSLPPPPATPPGPAVRFIENTAGGAPSACSAATTIGDTHLRTASGLHYDFQATGDFVLARTGSDFEVQSRQVSGAPVWPNAAVNDAIATRMGRTTVALCSRPARLVVDGTIEDLADGQTYSSSTGVDVTRTGDVYLVTDPSGNSVRAFMRDTYIDVSVGLGTWPIKVHGLLGNPDNDVTKVEASDGTVYSVPLTFDDLYRYGDSWRVAPRDSLLSVCDEKSEQGNPTKPFFVNDLEPEVRQQALAVCTRVGVKDGTLLDACTLDVAVLGETAAAVYVGATPPVLDGNGK